MNKVSALSLAVALATSVAAVVTTAEAQAQTLTTLHSFCAKVVARTALDPRTH